MSESENIEFKAYLKDISNTVEICGVIGAEMLRNGPQRDSYYFVPNGRLKIRDDNQYGKYLIFYQRLNSSTIRSSQYNKIDISSDYDSYVAFLDKAFESKIVVDKYRKTYKMDGSIINVDELENIGNFIEIEVIVEESDGYESAVKVADKLKKLFNISQAEIVSFSYADLNVMYESSQYWCGKLASCPNRGTLFLLDGCSSSGKTSLSQAICRDRDFNLKLVPRYCTRERREKEESEYIFVTGKEFRMLAFEGQFIEYRDFEFGMSYGLPWKNAMMPLLQGNNALGIMNLGNIMHVKKIFPDAITILIDSPIDTIYNRLVRRGYNNKNQIEERLENARKVESFKNCYDYIVDNDDGMFEKSMIALKTIITSKHE